MARKIDKTFENLFLKEGEVVLPKDKWNKLLEVLENHKDEIENLKMRVNIYENKKY